MLYNLVDNVSADLKLALDTTHRLCETVDTPRSLAVSLLLQYQEWEEYLDLSIDPSMYEEPRHFALDYLVTEIMRKNPDIPLGVDRAQVALDSFKESEAQCARTNERLLKDPPSWLETTRQRISSIVGPLSHRDLEKIQKRMRFGPGASTGVSGTGSSLSDKYDKPFHMTTGLLPYYKCLIGERWWEHHRRSKHEIVPGNKFTTVPKSAKTDRGICVEPTLNMYVQLGIGSFLRERLKRFGVDLNSQDRNRHLAREAYSKELCTIDLSAASDSVSRNLVLLLFSERWVELLSICRSDFSEIDSNTIIELEKWSSMGNGYTFELETLIFYAVCATFIPLEDMHHVNVYGDDIVIPRKYSAAVIDALNDLGFKVNHQKSFLAGNFFESCGHDYFRGHNVRPFYLKGRKDKIPYAAQIANKLRVYAHRLNGEWSCDVTFKPLWKHLVRKTPRIWRRCKVPLSFGDTGIISSFDEARPPRAFDGIEGWAVRHIDMVPVQKRKNTLGVLFAAFARLEATPDIVFHALNEQGFTSRELIQASFTKGREPKRGFLGKPRARASVVNQWTCGLTWKDPIL